MTSSLTRTHGMNKTFFFTALFLLIFSECYSQMHGLYDVKDFGARGDSITPDTKSIQSAIDKCNSDGGGTVLADSGEIPFRDYLSEKQRHTAY